MNPEANFDVSVDYNILNDAITAIKNIKSKCSQLISDLSSVDVSILDSAGQMTAAIKTAEGVMDGPIELVLGRIMEVETLFYMMQNQDFFVDLQEAMQSGKFNDEKGNLDIAAVMEHIIMNADGRYQDLLEDEDFRRLFVEQNILSVYGISSMEELENVRNGYLDLTRQYESERNGIVYDASHVTRDFMNKLLENNYMFADFDTVAAATIMAYSYTDVNGMEIMVDSLDAVPAEKRNQAKQLSYADLCGDSELYGELKECLNGKASLAAIAFSSGLSDFEAKIDADIEASEVRLAELDVLINGVFDEKKNEYSVYGSRTYLDMADRIVNDVNAKTNQLTNLYGYMIKDDFEALSSNTAADQVRLANEQYMNNFSPMQYNPDLPMFLNNGVTTAAVTEGTNFNNILYSLVSGDGQFTGGTGDVFYSNGNGNLFDVKCLTNDTLSNYSYWASQMTDDEKACFYYEWNKNGDEAAVKYLENISGVLDTRWVTNQIKIDGDFAKENKAAASIFSVLANPVEGFSALKYSIMQGINDDNMTRTQVYSHGDTMRQTVSSELAASENGGLKSFAYNVGMSMADNMYSMIISGGNSTLSGLALGVSSYNDSINDALDRGLTDEQARMFATASAGVEMVMEKMSIDELLKIKPIKGLMDIDVGDVAKLTDTKKGLRNFFGALDEIDKYTDNVFQNNILSKISGIGNPAARNLAYDAANVIYNGVKQGIGEGNEEFATSIAGRFIDKWIADENSSYNISLQSYINRGYTEAEALAMVNSEFRDELVTSWLSGVASGTTMGGGQTIRGLDTNYIKIRGILSDYKSNPNYESQLAELKANMHNGHYDAALTMVVDNGTSYEQGMRDANKLVDSLLNKGMISEEGKTQLNTYLEADAKAHSVLAGTSYETGNNAVRNNMRAGNYDAALTMVVDDNASYGQGMSDANKMVDSMHTNGMISEEGKTQLKAYLEADAKAHSVLAGTSYETGNNVIRSVIREDIMNEKVEADSKYQRGLIASLVDANRKQNYDDATKIISNMKQNGIITEKQQNNMMIAAQNAESATDMVGHLQKGDAAATLAARKNPTVLEQTVVTKNVSPADSDSQVAMPVTNTDAKAKATEGVASDLGVVASSLGLGLTATGTAGLGTTIAALGTETDTSSDSKPKVYSDERIVIEAETQDKYEPLGTNKSASREVSQSELVEESVDTGYELKDGESLGPRIGKQFFAKPKTKIGNIKERLLGENISNKKNFIVNGFKYVVNLFSNTQNVDVSGFHQQIESVISEGGDLTELLNSAPESLLTEFKFTSDIKYTFSEKTPDSLKSNADFIMACVNTDVNSLTEIISYADLSVLSAEQLSEILTILNGDYIYNPNTTIIIDFDRNITVKKCTANDKIIADAVISSPSKYLALVVKTADYCSSDILNEHIDEVLPILKANYYNFDGNSSNAQILSDAFLSDISNYSDYVERAVNSCSKSVLMEHMSEILPILNGSYYSFTSYNENSAIIADSAVANNSLCPALAVKLVRDCSENVLIEHMDEMLPILNASYYYLGEYRTNDKVMADKIIGDAINDKSTLYPNLFGNAVNACSDILINEHINELLPILSDCNYTVTFEYGNMRKSFIAESIIKSPIKYPNLVVQAVSCCSENIIIKNIGDILPVLNITGYTFDSFASNNQVIMDAFVADYASYPNLVTSFIDSSCLGEVSTDTQLKMLEIAQVNGYKLNTKSNFAVLNSLLERMIDLSNFDGKYKDYLSSVIENIGCAPLYFTGYDGLFSYEMIDTFGVDSITEIYKYITLKDVDIDFKLLIDSGKISDFKLLYDDIFKIDVIDSNFDIFSFKNFCNKYLENIQLFDEVLGSDLSLEDKTLLKRFVVEDFGVEVKSLDDLRNYDQLVNAKVSEIINSGNLDSIKDVGSKLLFNMSNEKMGEFLYTYGDSSRISLLSSKVGNSEFLSGAAVLLDFFEKNILNNSDTERVRNIVDRLNSMKYEERASISKMFSDIERVIKYHYGEELNGNLTKLSEITSTETVNTREVGKYTGVKHLLDGSESSALVDYVEINSNYRFLQHTLNAYGYGGKITDFLRSRLVGNSYICLSLVGDDKVGVYRDATSINSVSLLFDTIVPQDLLLCGSEDLSSSTKSSNDLEVGVHYSRKDRLRFDISDNILTNTSNDYHNEYTVYRDHIKPSGILVTGIVPNQAEIDAAATLGVPLVKINYKHNSDNSTVVESVIPSLDTDTEVKEFVDYLNDDNSIEISDDDGYELQPGESLRERMGMQFFANPKTAVDVVDNSGATNSLSSGDVSDIVAELEIYTEASKEGHGSIVKISSETKDNIAKLNAQQLLEVIKNTDLRYGMRTVMNSANSEQLSIVINDMISNSDSLISNPKFVRALSGCIDYNVYTSLVDSILSNGSGNNRLISTLSDAGIFELFNKYSENSKMLKRLFNNMSASQYTTIYTEYFDDQLSGTIISDLLENSILKDLSNKQLGVIFDGLYGSENLEVIDFANEKLNNLGNDRISEMVNDGTLIYNTELPPMVKKLIYKNINKSRDVMIRALGGEYGVNQNAVGRNVTYYVTKPWVKDLKDFANFLKEANECSFASAYAQAVLCNTPLVPLSAGNRVFITRYMAINSEHYSTEKIMEMNRAILKRNVKSEYRRLLNRYIIKGVDMKVASMIFDSIDATGACSYATFANLIVDSYKDNPDGFKKDFGFDLYEEVDGKKQFNSKELITDMFIFMNSIENGGNLFRYNGGNIRLINGSINPQDQVYVSEKDKFYPCAYNYLASKNPNLKLNDSGVINAQDMSKDSLKNAIAQALQSGKRLDMHIGRNLLKPVNFHGPLGVIVESTLTWSEGGGHAVYVTGMTDNALIVSSWGMRLTIPFSNLVKNPDVAFIVTQLENMSSVAETSVATNIAVAVEGDRAGITELEVSSNDSSFSIDVSNLDAKGVADLLVSVEFDDDYDSNINQIFRSLSDDKFIDVVKYMKENNMFDCDMIGGLDSKLLINKLEILYDNSPELISPFVEDVPGMMGSIIEELFTNSSNINYGLIETILNCYDSTNLLTVVNDSPSLKNNLDMFPKFKEIYISEQQNTLTSYRINETRLSVNLFTMDIIDTIVNSNSSIDITNLLNDSTFNNDALTILLDKLAKSGKINIKNSIISSLDSGRLFEIINNSIKNGYKLTSVIDSLSTEQFVSFVEQLSDDSVKSFLEQVSLEKIVSVYADLGLSGRYKLDSKFGNFVDMLNLSIYSQKVNDGSMRDYVIQLSDSEFNEFIDEILRNEVVGVTDLVETIIGYDSDRISNMIENATLEFNDKLPESIKRSIMEKANVRERAFESTADGTIDIRSGTTDYTDFGIDQDITRKHVKFTVKNNSWMKSLDHFVEFIIEDAKRNGYADNMTKERALEFAKELSTPGTVLTFSSYDIITRYLANNYLVKDALKYSRDSFIRENSSEYKRVLDKITPYCKDVVTATKILDCINSTGVCSYAAVANVIFDYYKDIPDQFRKDFGFDLFVEVDGEKRINEIELLADMYITINSDQMNGKLFRHGGFLGRGKLQTMSNLDTRFQVYMSNSSIGVDLDLFNKYLSLKNKDLVFRKNGIGYEGGTTGANSSAEIKKMFVDGLRSGAYIDLGISKTDKKIRFNYPDGSTYNSTFDWDEGGGHAVYVVGVTDDSVVVSSWGKKLLIPFEDLVDNKFRVSFLSKTDATTSPVTIPNVEVTQQNSDTVVNYTVSIDGSSYSVDSRLSFKDKVLEKYYDSVLKKISNKVNNSDLGYGTVSRMIEKSMGDYFKKLTSGSKIYEIMSSLNNKQMLFYAVNNCDLSLLSNEQLQGIINRAVKNGYVLNSYSSQFVKSNSNIIMRLLQPDSYYFRKNAGNSDSAILKNRQRQEAFIEFVNSINYSDLNSEQISEIIDIAVKNGYYISEKSPGFIRGNIEIISKVIGSLNEKYQYNQTLNSIDYSTLSDTDLLILADCVGKCRFGISEFIPSSLRSNFEFIMQVVNSSADGSINSKLSGVDYSNFSDQQLLDLMRVAVNKGYVLDVHSPIERLNIVLENDVKTYLETISSDYKELLIPIIDRLGYSSVGIEGYNGIFSQDMLSRFGVDFITDMYKYCNLTGSKVNFGLLISNGQIDTFKQIFDSVLGSKYNGTLSDIKLVKKIFDKCINNSKLFEDILSSDINDDVISNLIKYVNSNFRIEVNSVDELMQYDSLVKDYVDGVIASGDISRIKNTISLLLFNASDGDMYDFNQTFGGTKKIDILAKKLGDSELCSILKGYSVLLKFYQNKVASNNNSKTLISICEKLNNMSYDDRMSYLKVFDDIDGFVRYCYGMEVNESLTKLDSIIGTDAKNIRVDGKYTWQDGNEFVSVDYVEINSNYRLFQHTLNAFGEGGKLSDYQSGRVVGKSYLCLSMIGDNKIGVIRETSDVDHVTLLFDSLVSQDLMACAPRDIGSGYRTENNELFINNRGSRFDIVDNILSDTSSDSYNEYVIYRNNAKPAGILVTGVEANNAEIEAAARLGVPLVKINYSGNEKISSNNVEVSTEFSESMDEFVGYLTGKNTYTVTKSSPSGQIIYDGARNSDTVIDTTQDFEYELMEDESLRDRIGIQFFSEPKTNSGNIKEISTFKSSSKSNFIIDGFNYLAEFFFDVEFNDSYGRFIEGKIVLGEDVTSYLDSASKSVLKKFIFAGDIKYQFSELTPNYLRTNPDFIMACLNSHTADEIIRLVAYADLSVLSKTQFSEFMKILSSDIEHYRFPDVIEKYTVIHNRDQKNVLYGKNNKLIVNYVISNISEYPNLVPATAHLWSSDLIKSHLDDILPFLTDEDLKRFSYAGDNAKILSDAIISNSLKYPNLVEKSLAYCSESVLVEHIDQVLPILNSLDFDIRNSIFYSENIVKIISDAVVSDASKYPNLVDSAKLHCSDDLFLEHLDDILMVLENTKYDKALYNEKRNKAITDKVVSNAFKYSNLLPIFVNRCSEEVLVEHLDDVLFVLNNSYSYCDGGGAVSKFIANSVVANASKYPNLVSKSVGYCSGDVLAINLNEVLTILNELSYSFAASSSYYFDFDYEQNYTQNSNIIVAEFLNNFDSYPNLCCSFINSKYFVDLDVDMQLKIIDVAYNNGYKLNVNSNFELLNTLLEPFVTLDNFDGKYREYLSMIIENIGCSSLYFSGYDGIFSYEVIDTFGIENVFEIYKYVILKGVDIDFKSIVELGKISDFKLLYDSIFMENNLGFNFDIFTFKNFCSKYLENFELFDNVLKNGLSLEDKIVLKRFVNEDFGIEVKSIDDLHNYDNLVKAKVFEILNSGSLDSIKDCGSRLLFNMSNKKMEEFLYTYGDSARLNLLATKIGNPELLHSVSILLDFLEKNILNNTDIEKVSSIVNKLNNMSYNDRANILKMFNDIERIVKNYYGEELNANLTKLSEITSLDTINTRVFGKFAGTKQLLTGDSIDNVSVDYIEINSNYRLLQHTLNAYGSGGKISDFLRPRLVGNSYICLSLIGDYKSGVKRGPYSIDHVTLLFDTVLPQDLLLLGSRDLATYTLEKNDIDVLVSERRQDRVKFDISDSILDDTSVSYHNEYTLYRDHIKPSGILVTGNTPVQAEIDAAATLGVPLVKIKYSGNDKINNTSTDTSQGLTDNSTVTKFVDYLTSDDSHNQPIVYDGARNGDTVIDVSQDVEYELMEGESLGARIGTQFFAELKQSPNVTELLSKTYEELSLDEKITILSNARVMASGDIANWYSANGENELEIVKKIMSDNDVYVSLLIKNEFLDWLGSFNSEIRNKPENVKLLALKNVFKLSRCVSREWLSDVQLMRECAAQQGISPSILDYVSEDVRRDSQFIENLVKNCSDFKDLERISKYYNIELSLHTSSQFIFDPIDARSLDTKLREIVIPGSSIGVHGIKVNDVHQLDIYESIRVHGLYMTSRYGLVGNIAFLNPIEEYNIDDIVGYTYGIDNTAKYTVVVAIPNTIKTSDGQEYFLGNFYKYHLYGKDDSRARALPINEMGTLPPEFVVGLYVGIVNGGSQKFYLNDRYLGLQNANYRDKFSDNFVEIIKQRTGDDSLLKIGDAGLVDSVRRLVDFGAGSFYYTSFLEKYDNVIYDGARGNKNILGISKNSMLEMKLSSANSRTIDGMIRDGKLNEYLSSLTTSEIYNGPLARHVYQFANKMDLDAMGDSFVLLTRDQFDSVDDFMDSIDDDLSQGLSLSQESVDMMDAMSSEEIVVVLDKLLDNSEYFESAKQVVKYIDGSVLGQVFDRIMVRDDSLIITSYLDAEQVVSLMSYYSQDSVWYDKFCRNVSYAKFTKVARVLNEMIAKGNLEAVRMRSKLDRGIDAKFVGNIRSKYKNGTLNSYLSELSNTKLGQLFETMIEQKTADSITLCDAMIEMIGPNKFNILVRNGYIKFDTRFSKETQRAILDIINQQKDGSLKELSVYGVDQGYIRSHIRYGVKTNWSDDVTDIASFLTKNYGLDVFEADGKALSLTSPGYVMDYEEHQMVIDYLSSKYGKSEAMRMASKIFSRKVDSRYVAALNKLVSHGTDIKTAQAILDCIDTTGVCSYASVANLIVDAYKDNPSQFKIDFGFDLYTYENGRKEINSTELLADMYVYINSNLCGGKLFTIKDGKVTTNSSVIDTTKQIYLSSNHGFETSIVNKYLHSKNPNVTINVTSASQFYADGVNSEVDNIKTAIVRAMQEGKQVTLGVYRTKGSQYSFLDERGVKKESTVDWSEGDGHAVYVTGVTDNGVVVSTWGKRRVIPFADFIDNMYSINFVEIGIDGSVSANNQRKVPIYSNPTLAINDGRGSVMDGASLTSGLSDSDKHRIFKEAKRAYFKSQLGSDILKYNQIYLQKGLRVKAEELNIDRRVNKNKKLKLDANAMIAARNKLSDSEAIKLGKKQFDIEADAYAQAVLDKAIETANSHVKNVSEESVDITEENVQTQTAADTTDQTTDVDNNNDNKENVNTDSNVDNNNSVNTNIVNKQIKLSKIEKAKIIRDAKKGYIKEQLNGVNKDEFYRNLGYEVKAKEIQFNTGKKKTDKINKNALKSAKNLLTDSEAIKLGKETLEAQALEYAEKRVEDILAGKLEYKSKGSPIKKLAVTSVGAIVLLSYLGSIGDISLGNDLLGDDILGNDDVDDVEPSDDEDSSDDGGNGPTNPEGGSPGNPDVGGSDDVPEITDSNVMEPNEDVASTIPQDIPVIENVIEEVANGTNYNVKTDYVTDGIVEIPNVGEENLNEEILDDELINSDEPYLIPMSSDYVDMSDKKDVTGKGLVLGGMGLATLGALGTKLYLDKKKEDEEFEEDEFAEELEQEDNQDDIELIDNNDEEVDSDYEVPIFYSDTLKDEE